MLEEHGGRGVRMSDIARASGISRQAVYLHFASRTELLVAATRYLDEKLDVDKRLAPSRAATSGRERLSLYIECWGNYIPDIYGVGKALLLARDSDEAAAAAWDDRMAAMRDGCRAAIDALHADGHLAPGWSRPRATDALWALLLVPNWEALVIDCGWTTKQYVRWIKNLAERTFVRKNDAQSD
jgi:AcrR family transcriptional regulator